MAGKHLSPHQKTEALTLRAAGYTYTVISDRTGISVSSLKRLFKDHDVTKGKMRKDAIEQATKELINDANAIEFIKREVASLILDDVAIAKRIRQVISEAADKLIASDTTQALQVMRAASSASVALKSTSETLRKSLGIDKHDPVGDELPELKISIMTDQEIESVKEQARNRAWNIDDGLGGSSSLDDEYDEVVIYDEEGMVV